MFYYKLTIKILLSLLFILISCDFSFAFSEFPFSGKTYFSSKLLDLNDNSKLNPKNILDYSTYHTKISTFLNKTLDISDNSTIYLSFEHLWDNTKKDEEKHSFNIQQAYLDLFIDNFHFRAGKQLYKLGTGYFFNPLDIFNDGYDLLSSTTKDEEEGSYLYIFSYALNDVVSLESIILTEDNTIISDIPLVFKLGFSPNTLDSYCFIKSKKNTKPVYGVAASWSPMNLNNYMFYFELINKNDYKKSFIEKTSQNMLVPTSNILSSVTNYVIGMNWTVNANNSMTIEYYHNQENWNKNDFHNYLDFLDAQSNLGNSIVPYLNMTSNFRNSENYLALMFNIRNFYLTDLHLYPSWIFNLADGSGIILPSLVYKINQNLDLDFNLRIYYGDELSEFGNAIENLGIGFKITAYF